MRRGYDYQLTLYNESKVLDNKRVDNIKEAVQLYLAALHFLKRGK